MATMTPLKYPPPPCRRLVLSGVFSSSHQQISGEFQNSSLLTAPTFSSYEEDGLIFMTPKGAFERCAKTALLLKVTPTVNTGCVFQIPISPESVVKGAEESCCHFSRRSDKNSPLSSY